MAHTAHISVEVKRPQVRVNEGRGHHYVRIAEARQSVVKAPRPVILTQKIIGCKITFGGHQGAVGPAGPEGPSGQTRRVRLGEAVGAFSAIYLAADGLAYAADAAVGAGVQALVGILLEDGDAGDLLPVQTGGQVVVPSANFAEDRHVILAASGALTQGKPAGLKWHAPLARALSPTQIEIDIQTPIERLP